MRLRLSRLLATMVLPSHAQGGGWRMPKALLLLLAFFLAACSVQARPPRTLLGGMPARFVELPLDIGIGDEVTVRGEGRCHASHGAEKRDIPRSSVVYNNWQPRDPDLCCRKLVETSGVFRYHRGRIAPRGAARAQGPRSAARRVPVSGWAA